jgi:hypothetical protein
MNDQAKTDLTQIVDTIESNPTPHAIASAVKTLASYILARDSQTYVCGLAQLGEAVRAHVADASSVVDTTRPADVVITAAPTQPETLKVEEPAAETDPLHAISPEQAKGIVADAHRFAHMLEEGSEDAWNLVRAALAKGKDATVDFFGLKG